MKQKELLVFCDFLTQLRDTRISISKEFVNWLIKIKDINELEALEILEINFEKIQKIISSDIDFHKSRYTFSKFQFATYDKDILIQTHLNQETELMNVISSKIEWWKSLSYLIKSLDWRDFELLAKQILSENELTEIQITQASNDQGIDFFGYYNFPKTKYLKRLPNDLIFRVVGQVKHSSSDNGVDHQKIASFGTEIIKLRKLNNSAYFQNLDDKFLYLPYPIIGIFITNSYYPKKAVDFANEYGIIFWDGVQISQDLATPTFINKIQEIDGTLSKDKLLNSINSDA